MRKYRTFYRKRPSCMEQPGPKWWPCLSRGCVHIIDAERRISSIQSIAYHQHRRGCISSIRSGFFFMHGRAVMICKGQALDDMQRLAAFDDMPNLATLRFGYKKCRKNPTFFWCPLPIPRLCGPTRWKCIQALSLCCAKRSSFAAPYSNPFQTNINKNGLCLSHKPSSFLEKTAMNDTTHDLCTQTAFFVAHPSIKIAHS